MTEHNEAFCNSTMAKLDARIARVEAERDLWRALLCGVVTEPNAERMFSEATRAAAATPSP